MEATSRHHYCINMYRIDCLLVLAVVFQVIAVQGFLPRLPRSPSDDQPPPRNINPKCAQPPDVKNPRECCKVSPMYSDAELAQCGIEKLEGQRPKGPPDCIKQECLLQIRNLTNADNSINYPAVRKAMDKWVEANPEFTSVVGIVKDNCITNKGAPGPSHICEVNRLMFCTGSIIFSECPTWQDTEDCTRLKQHMEDCRPKFD